MESIPLLDRSTSSLNLININEIKQAQNESKAQEEGIKELTFFEAAQQGNLTLLEQYISTNKHTANEVDAENCTALHWAALNAHMHVAKFLISKGADVNAVGGTLIATPMHWAARSGHLEMCVFLVNCKADANIQDNQGFNSLLVAVHSGNMLLVIYFLAQGIDVDSCDKLRRTPLVNFIYYDSK